MKNWIIKILCVIIVGMFFIDTESKKQNRLYKRYNNSQMTDLIPFLKHMSRPLKFEE